MSDDSQSIDPAVIAVFEEAGEEQVRLSVFSNLYPTNIHKMAIVWLGVKYQRARDRSDASQASQMRTALSAEKAAWIAATAAIIAVILAITSIIIAWLTWRFPHH